MSKVSPIWRNGLLCAQKQVGKEKRKVAKEKRKEHAYMHACIQTMNELTNQLLKNKVFRDLREERKWTEDYEQTVITNNRPILQEFLDKNKYCGHLENCNQDVPGFYVTLTFNSGRFYTGLANCKHQKRRGDGKPEFQLPKGRIGGKTTGSYYMEIDEDEARKLGLKHAACLFFPSKFVDNNLFFKAFATFQIRGNDTEGNKVSVPLMHFKKYLEGVTH